jgi:hypothetical protein
MNRCRGFYPNRMGSWRQSKYCPYPDALDHSLALSTDVPSPHSLKDVIKCQLRLLWFIILTCSQNRRWPMRGFRGAGSSAFQNPGAMANESGGLSRKLSLTPFKTTRVRNVFMLYIRNKELKYSHIDANYQVATGKPCNRRTIWALRTSQLGEQLPPIDQRLRIGFRSTQRLPASRLCVPMFYAICEREKILKGNEDVRTLCSIPYMNTLGSIATHANHFLR